MMSGRVNSFFGQQYALTTIVSATTVDLPGDVCNCLISGSATITTLNPPAILPGMTVIFEAVAGAAPVFTNTDDTTTPGQMDLGGSNITLSASDVLALKLRSDGSWVRLWSTNN